MTTPAAGGDTRGGTGRTGGGAGGGVGAAGTGYVTQPRTGRQRTFYPPRSSRRPGGPSRMLPTMTPTRPDGPAVAEPTLRAVLADAAGWYRGPLLAGAEPAVGLLRGRGLIDLAVDTPAGIRWQFGYAPGGFGGHLLTRHLQGRGHPDAVIAAAGLATSRSTGGLVDVLRDRLVVPLQDSGGVVGFTGRRLTEPLASAERVAPKWLNTATTALYRKSQHLHGLTEQADLIAAGRGRVVLVEGALDAVAVSLAGHIGLAAGGTALTADHAEQLRALTGPGRPLHVAYDSDTAGQAATLRAATLLAGWDAVQVFLPPGHDPASILNGHGARGLRRTLTQTRPLVDAAVDHRLAKWDRHLATANVAAAVNAVRDVAPLIAAAPPDQYARLIAHTAAYTGIPLDTVTELVVDQIGPDPGTDW